MLDPGLDDFRLVGSYSDLILYLGANMQRREFIIALGGAANIWPLAARAQQQRKRATIGFLIPTSRTPDQNIESFVQRLSDLGWIENRNVQIEYRWAEGERAMREPG